MAAPMKSGAISETELSSLAVKVRVPLGRDRVYKDECVYCFDCPESDSGLYVCMSTFLGFCRLHINSHFQKTGNNIFFHIKTIKKKKPKEESTQPKEKPTRLAIGVEGGFDVDDDNQYDIEEFHSIVVLPDFRQVSLPNPDLPLAFQTSIAAIITAESASKQEEVAAWDGETRFISKSEAKATPDSIAIGSDSKVRVRHAETLLQLDNGIKVPPSGWKCARCDLKDNLWLNLTDGTILCGRRYYDGSGGNNHAVEHYKEVGYPLAVKLGTITPTGADVYSYDEDAMVEDPKLAEHLAHFGINMMIMEKTDKTMTELEIDLNSRVAEWDTIQEAGSKLKPLFGPGYTGLRNLGNSCYMNSVVQVLYSLPDFINRYAKQTDAIFNAAQGDITSDFNVQMGKLGDGLLSGKYSSEVEGDPEEEKSQNGIAPRMFKSLVGRGHPEFSTNRQQDAQEFLLHLANLIERNSMGQSNPCDCLKFELEERIECTQSKQVRYTRRTDYILPIPVVVEAATNQGEVDAFEARREELKSQGGEGDKAPSEPAPRLKIPFTACLDAFISTDVVEDFYSSATKSKGSALRSTKLATFPNYLVIQLKKFTLGEDWVPKKLDVSIEMPDDLDLSAFRGQGLQPGEVELPEGDAPEPEPVIDDSLVQQLVGMGFAFEGCRKAVHHTKNAGIEVAMNWVLEHMGDPDFAEPLQLGNSTKKQKTEVAVNEENVGMIMSMGFTREQAIRALKATDDNLERAVDWIFSHQDELNNPPMETEEAGSNQPTCRDGSGKYQLIAFISHMGTSTSSGHYVCHIFKEGRWVIYNDRKVAQSEKPPKDLGYLYFYRRL